MPKIAPTPEIAAFCPKLKKNALKDGLDAKKDAKRDVKSSFFVVVPRLLFWSFRVFKHETLIFNNCSCNTISAAQRLLSGYL